MHTHTHTHIASGETFPSPLFVWQTLAPDRESRAIIVLPMRGQSVCLSVCLLVRALEVKRLELTT